MIHVELFKDEVGIAVVQLVNQLGQSVSVNLVNINDFTNEAVVDVYELLRGVYCCILTTGNDEVIRKKFVKK